MSTSSSPGQPPVQPDQTPEEQRPQQNTLKRKKAETGSRFKAVGMLVMAARRFQGGQGGGHLWPCSRAEEAVEGS